MGIYNLTTVAGGEAEMGVAGLGYAFIIIRYNKIKRTCITLV